MIRKSVKRFSEKIMLKHTALPHGRPALCAGAVALPAVRSTG
jgi:hypothetical protein